MDEFVLFAFLLFTANKPNSSVHFMGESTDRQSAFRFYLTFNEVIFYLKKAESAKHKVAKRAERWEFFHVKTFFKSDDVTSMQLT